MIVPPSGKTQSTGVLTASVKASAVFGTLTAPTVITGVSEHSELTGRDAEDQHPIKAITSLETELSKKADIEDTRALTNQEIEDILNNFFEGE